MEGRRPVVYSYSVVEPKGFNLRNRQHWVEMPILLKSMKHSRTLSIVCTSTSYLLEKKTKTTNPNKQTTSPPKKPKQKPKPTDRKTNQQTNPTVGERRMEMLKGMQSLIYCIYCSLSDSRGLTCLGIFLQRNTIEVSVCIFSFSALLRKHFIMKLLSKVSFNN